MSLILQAAGGALAATGAEDSSPDLGVHIMMAGLVFQVVTLIVFIILSLLFARQTRSRQVKEGTYSLVDDNAIINLRNSAAFKRFLFSLVLATICILVRSIFRVAELSDGFDGPIIKIQWLFIVFEGVLLATAVIALCICHPGFCDKKLLKN